MCFWCFTSSYLNDVFGGFSKKVRYWPKGSQEAGYTLAITLHVVFQTCEDVVDRRLLRKREGNEEAAWKKTPLNFQVWYRVIWKWKHKSTDFFIYKNSVFNNTTQETYWLVKTPGKIIGIILPETRSICTTCWLRRVNNTLRGSYHPAHYIFIPSVALRQKVLVHRCQDHPNGSQSLATGCENVKWTSFLCDPAHYLYI